MWPFVITVNVRLTPELNARLALIETQLAEINLRGNTMVTTVQDIDDQVKANTTAMHAGFTALKEVINQLQTQIGQPAGVDAATQAAIDLAFADARQQAQTIVDDNTPASPPAGATGVVSNT